MREYNLSLFILNLLCYGKKVGAIFLSSTSRDVSHVLTSAPRRTQAERGVLVPITAVIIFVIIFIVIVFAVDVTRVKSARAKADTLASDWCKQGAQFLPFTAKAVDVVANLAGPELNPFSFASISRVSIVSLTPDLNFPMGVGDNPFLQGPVAIPGNTSCPVCEFIGDPTAGDAPNFFPSSFWTIDTPQGAIGCIVEMDVDTIFSSQRVASSKAAHGYRVRGAQPVTGDFKPIIIGIDPTLEMRNEQRFRFGATVGGQPNFANTDYDALTNAGLTAFQWNRPIYPEPTTTKTLVQTTAPVGAQRAVSIMGCNNPFLSVRNTLLESIVDRLSRFWFTRANTQIVVIPPQNADGTPNLPNLVTIGASSTGGDYLSGDDLTAPIFQLPYINFSLNPASANFANFATINSGSFVNHLCPFQTCAGAAPLQEQSRRTIGVLRDCYHANMGGASIGRGGYITFEDTTLANASLYANTQYYEPPEFEARNAVNVNGYNNLDFWEQLDPGVVGISATELVRNLGRVEECPNNQAGTCAKPVQVNDPALAPSGLLGDIETFFKYVRGLSNGYPFPGLLVSPAPVIYDPAASAIGNPEDATNPRRSNILLVLSKRLNPAQLNAIRTQVLGLTAQQELTVVFIPTTLADMDNEATLSPPIDPLSSTAVQNMLFAFNATLYSDPTPGNKLFLLAPGSNPLTSLCTGPLNSVAAGQDNLCFRQYWQGLLLPDDVGSGPFAPSISAIAEEILQNRLLQKEIKL